jgi:hypothetical protein
MAVSLFEANKFSRIPSSGKCDSNVKSGDSFTFESGSSLIIEEGATFEGALTGPSEVVTATNVITAAESGKTFYLDALAGFVSTLPTAALGLYFKFVVKTAPTSNGYTITGTPADVISGTVSANGAETEANGINASLADNVIFVANAALVGDWVEFRSDGDAWYVSGGVAALAGLTANG